MKNTIFIPKKLKVGYQHRKDTYTQKLAYVIYIDNKGVLRKEKSWRDWIQDEDKPHTDWHTQVITIIPGIPIDNFNNEPLGGFVLNRKVGGGSSGWNHRNTYCRVYDPRGFEFEITIPNLLYILENTSSIKGKGLEGKFVYGWDGADLVLIPEQAPEFAEMMEFTQNLGGAKIKKSDLVPGQIYLNKKNEQVTYLGHFDEHSSYNKGIVKRHFFHNPGAYEYARIERFSGFTHLIKNTGETNPDFAFIMDELQHNPCYSPYDPERYVYESVPSEEINFDYYGGGYFIDKKAVQLRINYFYVDDNNEIVADSNHKLLSADKVKYPNYAVIYEMIKTGKLKHIPFYSLNGYPEKFLSKEELIKNHAFQKQIKYLKNGKIAK